MNLGVLPPSPPAPHCSTHCTTLPGWAGLDPVPGLAAGKPRAGSWPERTQAVSLAWAYAHACTCPHSPTPKVLGGEGVYGEVNSCPARALGPLLGCSPCTQRCAWQLGPLSAAPRGGWRGHEGSVPPCGSQGLTELQPICTAPSPGWPGVAPPPQAAAGPELCQEFAKYLEAPGEGGAGAAASCPLGPLHSPPPGLIYIYLHTWCRVAPPSKAPQLLPRSVPEWARGIRAGFSSGLGPGVEPLPEAWGGGGAHLARPPTKPGLDSRPCRPGMEPPAGGGHLCQQGEEEEEGG